MKARPPWRNSHKVFRRGLARIKDIGRAVLRPRSVAFLQLAQAGLDLGEAGIVFGREFAGSM